MDSSLGDEDNTNPTPNYNFELLADLRIAENNRIVKHFLTSKTITESVQLVKLWLIKRDLNTEYGGFDTESFIRGWKNLF